MRKKKIKVGLIIDEFFGGAGTGYGGYGILARNYIAKYIPCEDIQIDVLLGRASRQNFFKRKWHINGIDIYKLPRFSFFAKRWLKKKNYDVYLSIELTYDYVLRSETNPNKHLILWIQDPRPKYEWDEINTVKLFPESNYYNQQIYDTVHIWNKQGRVKFISQGYFLNQKAVDLYRLPENTSIQYVPNPVEIDENFDVKKFHKKDSVIFLGRIESVKRGWLFCEIARKLPEYQFYMLGQTFREKEKNSSIMQKYMNIPNLHFAGHVDGEVKETYLKEAKILVNTSIHEALPVSFLEALAHGTVLVSNRNPENLTSQFGIWTGDVLGDGFDKVELYANAVKELMTDDEKRRRLSEAGFEYVKKMHNISRFIHDLRDVIRNEAGTQTDDT
jgi:glycosyltransferase involved in cell wall biosynthesis